MKRKSGRKNDHGPLVGALLRLAHAEVAAKVRRGLSDGGYDDLQPPHLAVSQLLFDRPEGARPTELAQAARITKQSMAATIDQLVNLGYVERVVDPRDKRAQLVRFTKRGWDAAHTAREMVHRIEREWARRIGAERFAMMRGALAEPVASFE